MSGKDKALDWDELERDEQRLPPAPWELWTSCSFRRITGPDGKEGGVLHAYNQRSDGHPDLSMPEEQLQALVRLRNALPRLLQERRELREARAERDEIVAFLDREDAPHHNEAPLSPLGRLEALARDWGESTEYLCDALKAWQARAQAAEVAMALWEWLAAHTNLELDWGEIDEGEAAWRVHRITGGRNDREWELIATGATPLEAVRAARTALSRTTAKQP